MTLNLNEDTLKRTYRLNELELWNSDLNKLPPDARSRVKDAVFYSALGDADNVYDYVDAIDKQLQKGSRYEDIIRATAKGLANVGSALQQGMAGMLSPMPAGPFGPRIEQEQVEKEKQLLRESAELLWRVSQSPELAMTNDDIFAKATDLIGQTLPYIASTVAAGIVAGPAGAFAVGSLVEGNTAYRTALDEGVDPDLAMAIGVGVGIISGAIESAGFKGVEKLFKRAANKYKNDIIKRGIIGFASATVIEALEEGSQEIAQLTGESIYRDINWNEAVTRTLGSMAGGAFLGGAMKGGGVAFRRAMMIAAEPAEAPTEVKEAPEKAVEAPTPPVEAIKEAEPTVKPEAEKPKPAKLEPWEMTFDEYKEWAREREYGIQRPSISFEEWVKSEATKTKDKSLREEHRKIIKNILSSRKEGGVAKEQGWTVPREVLEEYKGEAWADEALAPQPVPKKAKPKAKRKVSRLAERTQELAIEKELTESLGELPTYETMKMSEQAKMASEEINKDYEKAKQMALGKVNPPKGLRPAAIYEAVKYKAVKDGDVETLRQLATESTISQELSALGQQIKAADTRTELADPVKAMQKIQKARKTRVKKKHKVKTQTKQIAKEAKQEIRKKLTHRQTWNEFVESIRC